MSSTAQKLFRFRYEPCQGMCYAYCHTLMETLRKSNQQEREDTVNLMVEGHAQLCDNPDYSFGVDLHPEVGFVGFFRTPERTDTFADQSFPSLIRTIHNAVMMESIPTGDGECVYGDNGKENLGQEILSFCEDAAFNKLKQSHCPCKED